MSSVGSSSHSSTALQKSNRSNILQPSFSLNTALAVEVRLPPRSCQDRRSGSLSSLDGKGAGLGELKGSKVMTKVG